MISVNVLNKFIIWDSIIGDSFIFWDSSWL